jgi:gliding motility-associated protein GldM
MNILYAGYEMDVQVAVAGVANTNVTASMTNGSLTRKADGIWVAKASTANTDAVITATAKMADGRTVEMKQNFRVRPLPDPTPYLTIAGEALPFKGGALSRNALLNVNVAQVAIDDGTLYVTDFTVLRFQLSATNNLGVDVVYQSDGARFSDTQKSLIRDLPRGRTVLLRGIVARGPDGIERPLKSPLEIIIN